MRISARLITEAEQAAVIARMREGRFRAADLTLTATNAGVEIYAARVADRLIQRERQAGRIRIVKNGPYWKPV